MADESASPDNPGLQENASASPADANEGQAMAPLPADAAAQYLLEATNRSDRAGADNLAARLGSLPLALSHAAAYCRSTGMDFAAYRKLAGDLLSKTAPDADIAAPVLATYALGIARAAKLTAASEKLMGLAAFWAPDRIPLSLFPGDILSDDERAEATAALSELALIGVTPLDDGAPGLAIHQQVQAAARARLIEMGEHDNAAALAAELVADAVASGGAGLDDRLMPHVLAVLEHAPKIGAGAAKARLLSQLAAHFMARADDTGAEPMARRAVAILERFEQDTGERHPGHAAVAASLATIEAALRGESAPALDLAKAPAVVPADGGDAWTDLVAPHAEESADAATSIAAADKEVAMAADMAADTEVPAPAADAPVAAAAESHAVDELPQPPAVAPGQTRPAAKATFLNWMFGRQ